MSDLNLIIIPPHVIPGETLTTNQIKDTTVYGNFYNASSIQTSTHDAATAKAIFRGNVECNGDLYLGTTSIVYDENGFASNVSSGGNICVNDNGLITVYPASMLASVANVLTMTYLNERLNGYLTPTTLNATTIQQNGVSLDTKLGSYVTNSSLSTSLGSYVLTSSLGSYVLTSSLGSYVTNSSLSTSLGSYVTNTSLTNSLGSYVTNSSLTTSLGDYVTNTSLSGSLNSYYQIKEASNNPYITEGVLQTRISARLLGYIYSTSLPTILSPYLTTTTAAATYQLKGSYLTTAILDSYLTSTIAASTYQPIGTYLTSTIAASTYQLKGIICSDTVTLCTLTFTTMSKFGRMIWNGIEWKTFYNLKNQINNVHLYDKNKDIFPSQYLYIFNGDTLQSFYCKDTQTYSTDYNEYIVNKLGEIIAVKNTNTYFLRSDLIQIPIFQIRRK